MSLTPGYLMRLVSKDDTFYTALERPDEILVIIKAMRVGLSFPLDAFAIAYL